MNGYRLTVRFALTERGFCEVTAWARDRRPFRVSHMGGRTSSDRLPHDLATFVIEQALGLAGGFFNLTAHGATFRSADRRRTQPGRALIVANRDALDDAERTVNAHATAWADGAPTPAATALDDARNRWHDLRTGESFELAWTRLPLPAKPAPLQRDRRRRP